MWISYHNKIMGLEVNTRYVVIDDNNVTQYENVTSALNHADVTGGDIYHAHDTGVEGMEEFKRLESWW